MPAPLVVGTREFKTRLGAYLRQVREGRTLTITDRGRPVAEVMPAQRTDLSIEASLIRLRALGVVTGEGRPLPPLANPIKGRGSRATEAIVADREDRF